MRTISGIFSCLFVISSVYAQQKLTIEEAVLSQWSKFRPKSLQQVLWKGNSDTLLYVKDFKQLKAFVAGGTAENILLESGELDLILEEKGLEKLGSLPYDMEWIDEKSIRFQHKNNMVFFNVNTKKIINTISLNEEAEQVAVASNQNVAYTIRNNIYLAGAPSRAITAITNTDATIVNGSDYVHRQEFGINKGMFWSPKGNKLAYYEKNESMVTDYPLVYTSARIATENSIKYPMAGMTSEQVRLGVYDVQSKQTVYMQTGEPVDQYLTSITWDPSEKYIYIGVLNREQNHLKLNMYDASSGTLIKTLFEEKHAKYVEPEHPLFFLEKQPDVFIWQSERDGFNHLYLYNTQGKLIRQLTKGNWEVTEIISADTKNENVFFIATDETGMERHVYSTEIKSGKMKKYTTQPGTHQAVVHPDGKFIFDQFSSLSVPSSYQIIETKTLKKLNHNTSENPLASYSIPEAEMVTITSADGTTPLNGRIIKPKQLEPGKKYPVVVYVYGGPHAQLVTNSWLGGARLWEYYMAQEGYIMFTLDNRGSAHRGLNFENVIHQQLGQAEMADQMKGIEYLTSLPYVDANRIGVHGWSFGGFMTISLLLNHPNVFKVGVSGGPVTDWKYYEVMYGERYMDTPQENPLGYDKTSVINKAKNLDDHLLVIHGAQDDVVVWQHSLEFIEACIKNKKQVDYFVYPSHKHNVVGKDRLHLMQKVTDYFQLHLK
jgi:dipeptidyl-peptidase-4